MTTVFKERNIIVITGHANYSSPGTDIVCAAVSMLSQNLINSLDHLTDAEIMTTIRSGYIEIVIKESAEGVQLLVDSFFIGMEMLAEAYPNHVKVLCKH